MRDRQESGDSGPGISGHTPEAWCAQDPLCSPRDSFSPISSEGLPHGEKAPLSLLLHKARSCQHADAAPGSAPVAGALESTERASSPNITDQNHVLTNCSLLSNDSHAPLNCISTQKQNPHRKPREGESPSSPANSCPHVMWDEEQWLQTWGHTPALPHLLSCMGSGP